MTEYTKEEKQQHLLNNEDNILAGILSAAKDLEETFETVDVVRNDKKFFSFRVKPLSSSEYEKVQEQSTKYKRDKRGVKTVESFSVSDAHARLIIAATHPEDRKNLWANPELQKALGGVLTAHHVVPKVLKSGEIDAIIGVIDEISGNSLDKDDMIQKELEEQDELKN